MATPSKKEVLEAKMRAREENQLRLAGHSEAAPSDPAPAIAAPLPPRSRLQRAAKSILLLGNLGRHWRRETYGSEGGNVWEEREGSKQSYTSEGSIFSKGSKGSEKKASRADSKTSSESQPTVKKSLSDSLKSRLPGRRTKPALSVNCTRDAPEKRRVSFTSDPSEVHEAFTPYGKKYGAHPDDFYFDQEGHMVLDTPTGQKDILDIKVGDMVECLTDEVLYHLKPQLFAAFEERQVVTLGDQIVVTSKCGSWVKDSIGWLPLLCRAGRAFEFVKPKSDLKYAIPRVPVMGMVVEEPPVSAPLPGQVAEVVA